MASRWIGCWATAAAIVSICGLNGGGVIASRPSAADSLSVRDDVGAMASSAERIDVYRWRNAEIVGGGFVDGLIFSPAKKGLLYARTDIGGAYRMGRNGVWIPLNDDQGGKNANLLGCESLAVDPTDPNRVYMAAGTYTRSWSGNAAILRSENQGGTWQRTDLPIQLGGNEEGRSIGERLAVDPNLPSILYFGSRNDGMWMSSDHGASWSRAAGFAVTQRPRGIGVGGIVFDPRSGVKGRACRTIYATADSEAGGVFVTHDGGAIWLSVAGQPGGLPHHAALDRDGNLYITYGNGPGPNNVSDGSVWKFNTNSGGWTDITPVKPGVPMGFGYAGLGLDAKHSGTLMVSSLDRWNPGDDLFRSVDGGVHWHAICPTARLDSSTASWVNFGDAKPRFGWWIGALAIDPFAPGHVLYGTGATIWGSDDVTNSDRALPTNWTVHARGLEEVAVTCVVSPPSGAHLVSGMGDIGGFRHDDLDRTSPTGMWVNPKIDTTDSLDYAELHPELFVRIGRDAVKQNGAISRDGASTWSPFPTEPPQSRGGGTIAIDAEGRSLVWALNRGGVWFSTDSGATWNESIGLESVGSDGVGVDSLGRQRAAQVIADRCHPNAFFAWKRDALFGSTDGGRTFRKIGRLPPGAASLRCVPGHPGNLWLTAGDRGVFHSGDGGAHFASAGAVANAVGLGFGMAAPGRDYPAIYITGQTSTGESGVFCSDDEGATWLRLNDSAHQWGWSGQVVTGDARIYGRVYMGTNGRGIQIGDLVEQHSR